MENPFAPPTQAHKNRITHEEALSKARRVPTDIKVWTLLADLCTASPDVPTLKALSRHAADMAQNPNAPSPPSLQRANRASPSEWRDLYWRAMRITARHDFDAFLVYIERYRRPEDKFYPPRRKQLFQITDGLNKMELGTLVPARSGKMVPLQELVINMPSRVGKTAILKFFLLWVGGRNSERTNLYCAYSSTITDAFYDGLVEILTDDLTYAFTEIFPENPLVSKSGPPKTTLDLGRKKGYSSITCRSLYATLNGACDATGYVLADDLIEGIEEAMSTSRLQKAQLKVDNDMLKRAVGKDYKIIWCGTPWSLKDPMGNRVRMLETDPIFNDYGWARIIIPGMDDNDESNFDYDYGKGFSTEQFRRIRATFASNDDLASWETQVQCNPVERFGQLFPKSSFPTFNGTTPAPDADRAVMTIDPAWGGGDYVAGPIVKEFEGKRYLVGAVFNNGEKEVTQPLVARKIMEHGVTTCVVEANKMTQDYAKGIADILADFGYQCNIETQPAPNDKAKEYRISEVAAQIREIVILEANLQDEEYAAFMKNVYSFNPTGNNAHEDAPDALAAMIRVLAGAFMPTTEVGSLWAQPRRR